MPEIARALSIPGWMSEGELLWLAEQASQRKRIVELGCWKGRTTVALAQNTQGQVLAVDTWEGSEEHQDELKHLPNDYLVAQFMSNIKGIVNIGPLRMTSVRAASYFKQQQFDMIFLDAAHDYESVKADILAWEPLLAEDGLFCGHDYFGDYPGVRKAVNELLPSAKVAVGSIWYQL